MTNFLIGRGELLTAQVPPPKKNPQKAIVYTVAETQQRLLPQLQGLVTAIDNLSEQACPADYAVARLAMNPSFMAKSFFPDRLLRHANLSSVGSRAVRLTPTKWSKKSDPVEVTTAELFIAGERHAFHDLQAWMATLLPDADPLAATLDATHVERLAPFLAADRLKISDTLANNVFEVGIHLLPGSLGDVVREQFREFAESLDVRLHAQLSFEAGNLWFLPVEGNLDRVRQLADFSLIRVIQPMPRLRGFRPVMRTGAATVSCQLPQAQPLSSEPRVAILDGGLPSKHPLGAWVRSYKRMNETALDNPDGPGHGLAVTSAFLFGPIPPNGVAQRPYAFADHLRVIDQDTEQDDPFELYRTLGLVEEVLLSRQYEFVNLSLGPAWSVQDSDVHAWTSVIDDILSDGNTFLTVAIGNNGEMDRATGNARIQVPADCVNACAVGAATSTSSAWRKAPYSAFGPGRRPGVVKPDVVGFGGDGTEYFHVIAEGVTPALAPQLGTSFAAPYVMRSAVGIRAVLGASISPLAIKALLVHAADQGNHPIAEVGWGKVPDDLEAIITSPPGVARILYQGELKSGKYLRAKIPMPLAGITGDVTLRATFCFASRVDPQDAVAYTRAGLEVIFRPHAEKKNEGKPNSKTKTFFDGSAYLSEMDLRAEKGKWETVLHASRKMRGTSLHEPVFDVHYVAREGGGVLTSTDKIPYALVISLEASKHVDLYSEVLAAYPSILIPVQPQVSIPIRL